jgi:hypothetical protein
MRETYFGRIRPEHIRAAMREIDEGRMHGFGEHVDYVLEENGRSYPAKAVLGIARTLATGGPTEWSHFKGGYKLDPTFRRLGYTQVKR